MEYKQAFRLTIEIHEEPITSLDIYIPPCFNLVIDKVGLNVCRRGRCYEVQHIRVSAVICMFLWIRGI